MVPEAIGAYRIERRLGAGGMGEVYLAYDHRLDRRVALKRLRRDRQDSASRQRLRREARAVARLSHPSIVPLFDLLELDDGDWMVMEHVDGPSLAEMLRSGPLEPARVATYGQQVAEGLAAAHAQGIVHRDLKAENVLVAAGRARILDFGLVRNLEPTADEDTLTQAGVIIGTVRAMSPEQAQGLEVGPRSDVFSLGALLYEMLSGRPAFGTGSPAATLGRIISRAPDPLPPEVPAELAELVGQLLEKLPELRPAHARAVARRLGRMSGVRTLDEATIDAETIDAETIDAETIDAETIDAETIDAETIGETELTGAPPAAEMPASDPSEKPASDPAAGRHRPPRIVLGTILGMVLAIAAGIALRDPSFAPLGGKPAPPASSPGAESTAPGAESTAPGAERPADTLEATAAATLDEEAWSLLTRYDLEGNTDRAIELFQRLLEVAPSSSRVHAGLARAYYRKLVQDSGDRMWIEQTLSVARHAVELDGEDAEARVSLGLALVRTGRPEAARAELERALEIEPENADAYRGVAEIELGAGRFDTAETAFRQAVELRPGDRELHEFLGTLYFRTEQLALAEEAFRRSIEVAPDSVQGYRNLAGVFTQQGRLNEAAEILRQALEIQPTPTLYLNLGTVLFYQGLYPRSAAAYESALEFPYGANYHVTWGNLGDALRQIPHRRHEAPEAFRQAVRLLALHGEERGRDPWPHGRHHSQMALYRAKAGQDDKARREIEAAAGTKHARPLFRLAVACEILNDRQRALDFIARALAAGFLLAAAEREPELLALRSDPRYHRLVTPEDP